MGDAVLAVGHEVDIVGTRGVRLLNGIVLQAFDCGSDGAFKVGEIMFDCGAMNPEATGAGRQNKALGIDFDMTDDGTQRIGDVGVFGHFHLRLEHVADHRIIGRGGGPDTDDRQVEAEIEF